EILEDNDDRPYAAFAQQQAGDRLIGDLPVLDRVERAEWMLVLEHSEEIENRRNRVQERGVERQDLSRDFLMNGPCAVVNIDLEIFLEQLDHRQVRGR